jgi:hypothetical protein
MGIGKFVSGKLENQSTLTPIYQITTPGANSDREYLSGR